MSYSYLEPHLRCECCGWEAAYLVECIAARSATRKKSPSFTERVYAPTCTDCLVGGLDAGSYPEGVAVRKII
jgi:hypothetical protein